MLLSCPESSCDFEVTESFHMLLHAKLNHSNFKPDVAQTTILHLLDQLGLGMKPQEMEIDWTQMFQNSKPKLLSNSKINLLPHSNQVDDRAGSSKVMNDFNITKFEEDIDA